MEPGWLYKVTDREPQPLSSMPWPGQQGPLVLLLLTHSHLLTAAHSHMSATPAHKSASLSYLSATPSDMSATPSDMSATLSDMSATQDSHSPGRLLWARR